MGACFAINGADEIVGAQTRGRCVRESAGIMDLSRRLVPKRRAAREDMLALSPSMSAYRISRHWRRIT